MIIHIIFFLCLFKIFLDTSILLYGINFILFFACLSKPSLNSVLFNFLLLVKSNSPVEPCQLPVTEIINSFLVTALAILKDLKTASVPELQKINFE